MANIFKVDRNKINMNLLWVYPLVIGMLGLNIYLITEDIWTTVQGWNLLPTNNMGEFTAWAIALLIFGIPVWSFYVFGKNTEGKSANVHLSLTIIFLLIDAGFDFVYRIKGHEGIEAILFNLFLSIFIYSILTELLFGWFMGFTITYWKEFKLIAGDFFDFTVGSPAKNALKGVAKTFAND